MIRQAQHTKRKTKLFSLSRKSKQTNKQTKSSETKKNARKIGVKPANEPFDSIIVMLFGTSFIRTYTHFQQFSCFSGRQFIRCVVAFWQTKQQQQFKFATSGQKILGVIYIQLSILIIYVFDWIKHFLKHKRHAKCFVYS